jgi:formyl-CoA transferase
MIYATIKGFGTSGPYAHYRSYDMVAQAMGGSMSITGTLETEPIRSGVTYGDTGTGMQLAIGILAAYVRRLQTGEGGHVEVSMQDAIASYARVGFLAREQLGDPVPRQGNNLRGLPPTNAFPCKPFGANDFVYVVANTGAMLEKLMIALGRPELVDDPRLANAQSRRDNEDWLHGIIADWTRQRTKREAMDELQSFGVPAGATFDSGDIFNDPHLIEREMIQVVNHPTRGAVETIGNPIRLDQRATRLQPAPLLGEHTDEVLAAELGLGADELDSLRSAGVLGMPERPPLAVPAR